MQRTAAASASSVEPRYTSLAVERRACGAGGAQRPYVMWHWKRSKLDEFRRSELHYAARDGDADKVRSALGKGADVNAADANGWTPLHFAAQAQSAQVVRLLLESGGDVHAPDRQGNTVLWRA